LQLVGGTSGTVNHVFCFFFAGGLLWKRYYYYLTNGIRKDMIAPEEDQVMIRISKLISNKLLTKPALEPLVAALSDEKENDYYYSLMKSIGKTDLNGQELLCGVYHLSVLSFSLL
jgi:hypothetical protein